MARTGKGGWVDPTLALGAGIDVFTPVGALAQELLANGYSLIVDIAGYPGRPVEICWYLRGKGVPCYWPMMVDGCLCFVVDRGKAGYACALLRRVKMPALNPPAPKPRH